MSRSATATQDLSALFRARNPLIWIVTREEARVERAILDAAVSVSGSPYDVRFWDVAAGITDAKGKNLDPNGDPDFALKTIANRAERAVWVLRDVAVWLKNPSTNRALRNLARTLPNSPRNEARVVIVLSPSAEVPPELQGHAIVVDWPLPDREEIGQILESVTSALPPEIAATVTAEKREMAIDAAVGLTAEEASACYAKSLVTQKTIDPKAVSQEKKRVIARERVLEWFDPDPRGLDAVGGLDNLKTWLTTRKTAFSQRARDFGLPAPRGVIIAGVSGCGKSLLAKAVATAWNMPLLKFDLGALKSKWVGESEANIRKALAVAETVAPCILWADEIEKSLGGATQGAADGGVSADALGTLLNWMQERQGSVFVIATSNDVSGLPPELLRKGRFDDIFWVDLPTVTERRAILTATMKQFKQDPAVIEFTFLDKVTEDYTGAEIASLVPDALFAAFADGERALTTVDLINASKTVVPLAKTAAEKITRLREWAKGRARPASSGEKENVMTSGRKLDL